MDSWVTWATTSRAIGPRRRAAANTEAAAASATFSDGATTCGLARRARLVCAIETAAVVVGRSVVVEEVGTSLSLVEVGWWVRATPGDSAGQETSGSGQARRIARQQQQRRVATAA